jgi:HK97 family phage major capsid protein
MKLAELQARKNEAVKVMRDLHALAEKEDRGFSDTEQSTWNNANADLERLDQRIEAARRVEGLAVVDNDSPAARALAASTERMEGRPAAETDIVLANDAFRSWIRDGREGLTDEHRAALDRRRATLTPEMRAFAAGTSNVGGYSVAPEFYNQLEVAMKQYGAMLGVGQIIPTASGAVLPFPTFNYTSVVSTIIGEGSGSSTDSSTPFGILNISAYTYRSPLLPVSWEFLQDTAFGEGFITDALGQTHGRGLNAHLTTGTGTSQPKGIVTAATSGKVGTTGQTLSVIYDDLVDLEHSVDPAYRSMGCRWMMHDSSLKVVKKIKDSTGRPIFTPNYDAGISQAAPGEILGYPYVINQDMPVMAANAKSIVFGLLSKYKVRMVRDVVMLRLIERYADQGQVAFLSFMRAGGDLLDAGTNPVKYYANSAT